MDQLLLLYSWGSQLLIDMHKTIIKTFSFLEVITGRQRPLEGQTLDLLLLLHSWGSQLSFDMHKAIVKHFHFRRSLRSLEIIRGHQKVKHWICCCYCIPWVSSFHLICIKPQLNIFILEVILGHQRSLVVIRRSNNGFVAATVFPFLF